MPIKKLLISFGALAAIAAVVLPFLRSQDATTASTPNTSTQSIAAIPDSSAFFAYAKEHDLPVASVDLHSVSDASGTVILIPQLHKHPGSQTEDSVNDSPEQAQREITKILPSLSEYFSTKILVVEGIQYQGVPDPYIEELKKKGLALQAIDQIINTADALTSNPLLTTIRQTQKQAERELFLEGAPFALIAQGADYTIVGPENPETQIQAAHIIDRYIRVERIAGGTPVLASSLFSYSDLSIPLQTLHTPLPARMTLGSTQDTKDLPGDPETAAQELKQLEQEIQKIIIDQRNQETAVRTKRALMEHGSKNIIVQYGAGHLEGLVQELNDQGLSVIVVTPNEVATHK